MTAGQGQHGCRRIAAAAAVGMTVFFLAAPVDPARAATSRPPASTSATPTAAFDASGTSANSAASAPPSCSVSVSIGGGNSGLTLTPDHARVQENSCVLYTNNTSSSVSVQIEQGSKTWDSGTINPKGYVQYPASVTGTHDVSVQQTRVVLPASGAGTVRVLAAASGSPSPSTSRSTSSGHRSSRHPARRGSRRSRRAEPHAKATSRRHKRRSKHSAASGGTQLPPLDIPPGATAPLSITRRGGGSLPRVAGPQAGIPELPGPSASPTPSPSGSVEAADPRIAPLDSSGSAGADLALAIGGLLAVGQLAALLRVLAAVDNRRRAVGHHP